MGFDLRSTRPGVERRSLASVRRVDRSVCRPLRSSDEFVAEVVGPFVTPEGFFDVPNGALTSANSPTRSAIAAMSTESSAGERVERETGEANLARVNDPFGLKPQDRGFVEEFARTHFDHQGHVIVLSLGASAILRNTPVQSPGRLRRERIVGYQGVDSPLSQRHSPRLGTAVQTGRPRAPAK